jgi:hypothetical protein
VYLERHQLSVRLRSFVDYLQADLPERVKRGHVAPRGSNRG